MIGQLSPDGGLTTSNKPKVLFLFDHPKEQWWMDGLWAALNLLEDDFEITRWNLHGEQKQFPDNYFDFVLGWGAFHSTVDWHLHQGLRSLGNKRGLCIAGCAMPPEKTNIYDVLFYETKWYRPQIEFHNNIVHAFGINTDLFCPTDLPMPIVWDYLGVGALANWKRWELMANKKGNRLVVGEYQDKNEAESGRIALELIKSGVMVSPMVSPYDLVNLYHWSRTAYIPSTIYGGGERSVLEAKACGLEVEIEPDNPKLKELLDNPLPDHHLYAQQLKKGIMSCL